MDQNARRRNHYIFLTDIMPEGVFSTGPAVKFGVPGLSETPFRVCRKPVIYGRGRMSQSSLLFGVSRGEMLLFGKELLFLELRYGNQEMRYQRLLAKAGLLYESRFSHRRGTIMIRGKEHVLFEGAFDRERPVKKLNIDLSGQDWFTISFLIEESDYQDYFGLGLFDPVLLQK